MNYAIYNVTTGQILRNVSCQENDLHLQFTVGTENFFVGVLDDSKNYVVDGQAVAIPEKPSEFHKFNWDTKQWVDPRTPETEWVAVRTKRDALLQTSDWTDTGSAPARLGATLYQLWQNYRQALRDITTQTDPFNIVWPTPPQ